MSGYIGVTELARRLRGAYSRRQLSTLAGKGLIPDAERKPPNGKHWRFKDTPALALWIQEVKRQRAVSRRATPSWQTMAKLIAAHFASEPIGSYSSEQAHASLIELQPVIDVYDRLIEQL